MTEGEVKSEDGTRREGERLQEKRLPMENFGGEEGEVGGKEEVAGEGLE